MTSFYYIVLEHNTGKTEFLKNVIFSIIDDRRYGLVFMSNQVKKVWKVSVFDVRKSSSL